MFAYLQRYPHHPKLPVLRNSRVLQEATDGAVTRIERLCHVNVELPPWIKRRFGLEYIEFMQSTRIDREKREMAMRIRVCTLRHAASWGPVRPRNGTDCRGARASRPVRRT